MKTQWAGWFAAAVLAGTAGTAAAVQPGDSREAVLAELGPPRGELRIDPVELLYFERGSVKLRDGTVVQVDLVSGEEAARRRAERERQAAERRARAAEASARRMAEGEAERERLLSDPRLASAPADEQVRLWASFMDRYPEVDVSVPYVRALERYRAEQRIEEQERRLSELEFQVWDARQRAEAAEREAQAARRRSYVVYPYPFGYPGYGRTRRVRTDGASRSGLDIEYSGPGWKARYVSPRRITEPATTPRVPFGYPRILRPPVSTNSP